MESNSVHYLPSEMLEQIFLFLSETDAKTAVDILRVSKRYSEIIKNNKKIKYNIIMGVNGQANKTPIEQFQWACGEGLVEIMEMARNEFKITSENIKSNGCKAIINACINGHIKIAEELMEEYNINFKKDITDVEYFLELACMKGYEESIMWVLENVKKGGGVHAVSFLYDDVCIEGYLNAVKYLTNLIEFGGNDKVIAFRLACQNGHLEIAKFFVRKFELTTEMIKSDFNAGLRYACRGGYSEIVGWIVEAFGLPKDEASRHLDWYKAVIRALKINLNPRIIKVLEKCKN